MDINLIQQIIERPKRRSFGANAVKVTRSGLSSNPTQRLNYVSGDVFSNDALVKHGDNFFVGGDTATFEYDFSTKVAGSVAECPCRVYVANAPLASLPSPSSFSVEMVAQSWIDTIKTQDGTVPPDYKSTLNNGNVLCYCVEVDLTKLCNDYFGGSNSALKSALKAINVDCWAMGSGSNGGVSANGVSIQEWFGYWLESNSNTTSSIAKTTFNGNQSLAQQMLGSNNKLYILIASKYASDGTIASSVSLDYINVKVDLTRSVDTVQPISVNLPKYWAMVVKGFSPNWDINLSIIKRIMILRKDDQNFYQLYYEGAAKLFRLSKLYNNVWQNIASVSVANLLKFQVTNIIIGQTATGLFIRILLNNGTVVSQNVTDTTVLTGNHQLYVEQHYNGTSQADAFAESFNLIDLTGKPSGYTDAEATAILNGTASGWENKELFDINAVTLHANATRSNGVITLNANGSYQGSYIDISVLSNNRYEVKATTNAIVYVIEYYNNIALSYTKALNNSLNNDTFITLSKTNKVRFMCTNDSLGTGTFTFSNISLKLKM